MDIHYCKRHNMPKCLVCENVHLGIALWLTAPDRWNPVVLVILLIVVYSQKTFCNFSTFTSMSEQYWRGSYVCWVNYLYPFVTNEAINTCVMAVSYAKSKSVLAGSKGNKIVSRTVTMCALLFWGVNQTDAGWLLQYLLYLKLKRVLHLQ